MRRVSVLTFLSLLFASLVSTQANSAIVKSGSACTKIGVNIFSAGIKLTCIKSGKKLLWSAGGTASPKPTQIPTQTPTQTATPTSQTKSAITGSKFSQLAISAMQDPTRQVPGVDTNSSVKIVPGSANDYRNFLKANTSDVFNFNGPAPLIETVPDHLGALSLVTLDNRSVYKSRAALPPWGVTFNLDTKDPQGRFVVVTSAVRNIGAGVADGTSTWRLAFKRNDDTWKYQNLEGIVHKTNDAKYFDVVSLGAAGTYSIQLQFTSNIIFYGLGLQDSINSIAKNRGDDRLRVLLFGDSWTFPVINDDKPHTQFDAYPTVLAWLTGWNVIAAGVPGQGYLATSEGETYKDRIVRDVIPSNPDVVIVTGSPNDHNPVYNFTPQQIAEEVSKVIKSLRSASSNTLIVLAAPFDGNAVDAAQYKIQSEKMMVPFLDFSDTKDFDWSNKINLVQGHPSVLGSVRLARDLLERISKIS